MCNLCSQTKSQEVLGQVFDDLTKEAADFEDPVGSLQPIPWAAGGRCHVNY